MGTDRVIRCIVWTCRDTKPTGSEALSSGWGWFTTGWSENTLWRCPLHKTGKETFDRLPSERCGEDEDEQGEPCHQ